MSINDDKYADLIDNYQFDINVNNVIHNLYIDHLDHSGDSNYHHHHNTADDRHNDHLNVVIHNDDDCDPDDNIYVYTRPDKHNEYGPASHDHSDDGAED